MVKRLKLKRKNVTNKCKGTGISPFCYIYFYWCNNKVMKISKYILILIIILTFATLLILRPIRIDGNSMYPALADGDWVLACRASYIFSNPRRGDIVVFRGEDVNKQYLIKRVIGLEQETIEIIRGSIYIDDEKVYEKYAEYFPQDNFKKRIIPKKHFFMLGDNRKVSVDSRYEEVGFINKDYIIGKIIFKW